MMPERPEKKRMRKPILRKLLIRAAKRHDIEFGFTLIMLYTFLLRGPSEWWDQARPTLLSFAAGHLRYGSIVRKHKKSRVTLYRECVCQREPLFCAHKWWLAWEETRTNDQDFLTTTPDKWTKQLRTYLKAEYPAMSDEDDLTWTTHCCRRGAAADILHRQGLTGAGGLEQMLLEADWSTPKGSHPYTPADEIEAVSMGEVLIEQLD